MRSIQSGLSQQTVAGFLSCLFALCGAFQCTLLCVSLVDVSPGTQDSAEVAVLAGPLGGAAHNQVTEGHLHPLLIA